MATNPRQKQTAQNRVRKHRNVRVAASDYRADLVLDLKLEHLIVLNALQSSNLSHARVVSVAEIAASLSERDEKRLANSYTQQLSTSIRKILELLRVRGLVFSLRDDNGHVFHGSSNVLQASETSTPAVQSRRCRVMRLVREAVLDLNRAVRNSDILDKAAHSGLDGEIPSRAITHDVLSLLQTGELIVVGRVRGENKGINLYLPANMDADRYKPSQPLTWLDEVAEAVVLMWSERTEEAKISGLRPKPFSTSDVRVYIGNPQFHSKRDLKKDPQVLIDALKKLAETRDPLLRKIKRRGQKALLWVPAGVVDAEVDFGGAFANDAERMGAAVERAVRRLGRPVTLQDVKDEVEKDPALEPSGDSNVSQALSETAKETYNLYDGKGPQKHILRRVYRVGRAGGNAYYYTKDTQQARGYVTLCHLELAWSMLCAEEELTALDTVALPWAAKGRNMLLQHELEAFLRDVASVLSSREIDELTRRGVRDLKNRAEEALQTAQEWLAASGFAQLHTPKNVSNEVPVWNANQLLQVVKPLYPLAQGITDTNKFISLMYKCIRRVPNPEFKSRFSDNPQKAAEFFYDRADALIFVAKQWGGPECRLQAILASNELGRLRDPRFILPALESKNFEMRLAAIACLAFLRTSEGFERLRHIAIEDPDAGVRQSALWAFGFRDGEGVREFINSRRDSDPSTFVREFVREGLESSEGSWWML